MKQQIIKWIALVFTFAALAACELMPMTANPPPSPTFPVEDGASIVTVYFGTDRVADGRSFGASSSLTTSYGKAIVTIPPGHKSGVVERPSFLRLQIWENPEKHIVIRELSQFEGLTGWAEDIRKRSKNSAFIFIHGYNVTFDEAAWRTAQMAFDMDYHGLPVFYSWPSRGTIPGYPDDAQNIETSEVRIKNFIADFITTTEMPEVYLVGHSMGTRALMRALKDLYYERPEVFASIKEVVLAAPDIEINVFRDTIAPRVIESGTPITLYASSSDLALKVSKEFNGDYPRLGDSKGGVYVSQGIESIDASSVDTSLLGHSYVAGSPSILNDIYILISERLRAAKREGLKQESGDQGAYWSVNQARTIATQ